ncbi:MAG: hypothetical protein Q9164_005671 [Protoblastenia rupestris]
MGGFVLQTKDWIGDEHGDRTRDWVPFPVDADQLLYLVGKRYIELPLIDKRAIKEKDKVDGLVRILTICQILWFVVNVSGRAAQDLTITCLELTTAAFIVCVVGISACWYHKPADLTDPHIIVTDVYIQEILLGAGDEIRRNYNRTPLDFVNHKEWSFSICWQHSVSILRHMHLPIGDHIRPLPAFENSYSVPLPDRVQLVVLVLSLVYTSIFFYAWNFSFPTPIELTLWRVAVLGMTASMLVAVFFAKLIFDWYPAFQRRHPCPLIHTRADRKNGRMHPSWPGYGRLSRAARRTRAALKNNSLSKDPALDAPVIGVLGLYFFGFLYCSARAYIFIADFTELRSLPAKAYVSVEWTNIIPHL